ncbi:hypothetical protein F4818DRAFT_172868 [Hypoxylon cercidicola]|nr:hypothetical protein F4818DRAFT_172868 [Hypoxylon cercidicola]
MLLGPLFSLLALLAVLVSSYDETHGRFFNPATYGYDRDFTENVLWRLGETQSIKFTTTYSSYNIYIYQQDEDESVAAEGSQIYGVLDGGVTQFDWAVQTYDFDLKTSEVFFLRLWSTDLDSDDPVTSHYFNITASAASSSSSVSSPTPTSTSTTVSSSATTSTAIGAAASTSGSLPSATQGPSSTKKAHSLSTGAQAGIGVGVGLAGLIAIAAGVVLWRRRKNSRRGIPENQPEMVRGPYEEAQLKSPPPSYPAELDANHGVTELAYGTRGPVELR